MTDEELERKAEMYEIHVCGIHANSKLRKAYKDGYEEGRRIESDLIFESWCKDTSSPCGFLLECEAEIEALKNTIEKMKNCENCANFVEYATCAPMDGKPRFNESPLQKVKGCRLCGECKDKNLWRIKS